MRTKGTARGRVRGGTDAGDVLGQASDVAQQRVEVAAGQVLHDQVEVVLRDKRHSGTPYEETPTRAQWQSPRSSRSGAGGGSLLMKYWKHCALRPSSGRRKSSLR